MTTADAAPAPSADQPGGGGAATWVDVAPLLARARSAMQPGELVQADSFSLFESVSAVEIGAHVRKRFPASRKHSNALQDGAGLRQQAMQVQSVMLHALTEGRMARCVAGDPRVDAGADASCRSAEALVAAGAAPRQLSDAQVLHSSQHTVILAPCHKALWQQSCASCRTAARSAVPRRCTLHTGQYTSVSSMIRRCHAQVLAVMDRLTALEAAWHAGHFLPQSVYTCLYMLLPDRCRDACNILRCRSRTLWLLGWVADDCSIVLASSLLRLSILMCHNCLAQGSGHAAAGRLLQGGTRHLQHGAQPCARQQRVHGAHTATALLSTVVQLASSAA
jgi:Mak10 subunit, NatC N(alpha)-terminal acetyltransferase